MRRLAALTAAGVLLLAPSATAQGGTATLTPVGDGGSFPQRSFVLNLPQDAPLAPGQVRVREEGREVADLRVVPAGAAQRAFGVVLVLDTSGSMKGQAIEDAMAAARSFAERRPDGQALGLVTFNERAHVVLRPTTDEARIRAALAETPALAPETAINDGVAQALALLRESRVEAGSLVVLSDGSDTASALAREEVVAAAERQRVRIFSVGLESGAYSPATLRELAERTGGDYALARSSRSLREVFGDLGSRFSRELVITYRSSEPAGSTVDVVVGARGGPQAQATYQAPALDVAGPRSPSPGGFWVSTAALVLVAIVVGGLVAVALALGFRQPRQERLRQRMTAFGALTEQEGGEQPTEAALGTIYTRLQRRLSATARWKRFEEALDVARIPQSPVALASRAAVAAVLALMLPAVLGGSPLLGLGLAAMVVGGVRTYVKSRLRRQRTRFADQLADSLQVMTAALRAGHSLAGALSSVVDDAPEPTRTEFARVRADERLGVPIEECIDRMARRMDNRDLKQVAIVANLQQQTGGNTAEVLDRVVESVRERGDLRRLVRTLTAQGRMAHVVITALPVGVGAYFFLAARDYLQPLMEPGIGRMILIAALVMVAVGSYFIRRIIDIKV